MFAAKSRTDKDEHIRLETERNHRRWKSVAVSVAPPRSQIDENPSSLNRLLGFSFGISIDIPMTYLLPRQILQKIACFRTVTTRS
jgi:hypothetical protein